MDQNHWARKTKTKGVFLMSNGLMSGTRTTRGEAAQVTPEAPNGDTPSKPLLVLPKPTDPGAKAGILEGKTVVLTGMFPEVGGGVGVDLGKDRVKKMVKDFGGIVRAQASGMTDILVVGKDPGYNKTEYVKRKKTISLREKRGQEPCKCIGMKELVDVLKGKVTLDSSTAMAQATISSEGDQKPAAKKRSAAALSEENDHGGYNGEKRQGQVRGW